MSFTIHGIGVSRGVAIGRAHIVKNVKLEFGESSIGQDQVRAELRRFDAAIDQARQNLRELQAQIPDEVRPSISALFDVRLLMLADKLLVEQPRKLIEFSLCNAERAVRRNCDVLVDLFERMEDPYMRGRKEDVIHAANSIMMVLAGRPGPAHKDPSANLGERIVVAEDLSPEDTMLLRQRGVAAIATEHGGKTSHAAIMARSMQIPAAAGLRHVSRYVSEGEEIIVDGEQGVLLGELDRRTTNHYEKLIRAGKRRQASLVRLRNKPTRSRDGVLIELRANVELPEDFAAVQETGADGVGLYRTEFLFMHRDEPPDEEEHYAAYCGALETLNGLPLCIRTFDLGADGLRYGDSAAASAATNPALGMRAIRLCLREPSLFLPQLRAILRASARGKVRLLLPMVSNVEEVRQVLSMLQGLRQEFDDNGVDHDPNMPVGGMIEVPAAAVCAHAFARHLDFLAIGTNDLIQYALAVDRVNDEVSYLCEPLHPVVPSLIRMVLKAGGRARIPVTVCGEMASEIEYTRLLLALGLRELSVHTANLLELRQLINDSSVAALRVYKRRIQMAHSPQDLAALVREINAAG